MRAVKRDERMSPNQLGDLTRVCVAELARRSHAEGQALEETNFQYRFREMLDECGDFTCDWVKSNLEYPKAYKGLRPVEEQVHLLADKFGIDRQPALDFLKKSLPDVPKWAEGWAALPIQERFPHAHAKISQQALIWHSSICGNSPDYYARYGVPEGLTLEDHVRPHFVGLELEKVSCARRIFAWQWERFVGGRIMIVPVQMGAMRRGQSDRMVKAHCKRKSMSEFPLGIFEVACLLAMHPERVPDFDEKALGVNAPGDEYTPEGLLKSVNCGRKQMGVWRRFRRGGLPYFGFGGDGIREAQNGPVTASSWDIKAHLESSE